MVTALKGTASAPRAAIYIRVSSQQQEREGTSLETQEAACRRFCDARGYALVDEVYREVYSGQQLWERRALSKLRDAVRRGEIDTIVCYSVDRLARDAVHLGVIITEAEHAGCAVEFVSEPLDDTPEGQLVRFIKGFAAKVEAEKIRERTGRGRRARVEAGKPLAGNKCRYGYVWRDEAKTGMLADPVAAPIVRRVYRMVLDGSSLRSIAVQLNDEGIPSPSGRSRWALPAVRAILLDPLYCGLGGGLRYKMLKVRSKRTGNVYRQCVPRPLDEQIPYPEGTVPTLVTVDEYEAVQVKLERNKREATRNAIDHTAALLRAGHIFCGYSGHRLHYGTRGKGYECTANSADPGVCPQKAWIKASIVDAAVWERVRGVLLDPDVIEREVERLRKDDPTANDLAAVDRSIREVERQQRNLVDQLANLGGSVAKLVADKLASLDGQRGRLAQERAEIVARQVVWQEAQARIGDVRAWCERVSENIDDLTYDEKRDILTALDVRVKVYRAGHEPRWEITASLPLEVRSSQQTENAASNR